MKARELIAKHKLRPEDCQKGTDARVVVKTIGVECTKMTDSWAVPLGGIIAKRYCCKVYRSRSHGARATAFEIYEKSSKLKTWK